jgi:hypothetical protein
MQLSAEARRRILNPEPGTALARARDFGFDLTLILSAVERTPEERLERAARAQALIASLRAERRNTNNG